MKTSKEFTSKQHKLLNLQACAMHQEHNEVQSPKIDELQAGAWSRNLVHEIKTKMQCKRWKKMVPNIVNIVAKSCTDYVS